VAYRAQLILVFFVLALTGCTPGGKTAANVGIDLTDAVCKELDATLQDEPEWVKFTCSAVEAGSGVAHTFVTKVRKTDAQKFAESHCAVSPPDGGKAAP
jgi:hypothetical protein